MAELTSEQLKDILENYNVLVETNEKANTIKLKFADNKGDYGDTLKYAIEVGDALAETLKFAITDELLEDGILPKPIAKKLLYKLIKANFNNVSKECVKAQTILNKKSKIGLKPIPPTYNQDKTDGLVAYITEKEYKKREKSFLASVKQNSLSIVDDSVKANADFQYKSGMNPKIVRTTNGKCCEWCSKLAGTYDYYKVMNTGNNVFRRHANCECVVNYIPYKGKAVNVWTKKEVKKGYLDLLEKNTPSNKSEPRNGEAIKTKNYFEQKKKYREPKDMGVNEHLIKLNEDIRNKLDNQKNTISFKNVEEAKTYFDESVKKWLNDIDKDTKKAYTIYSGTSYKNINNYLRGEYYEGNEGCLKTTISRLDKGIEEFDLKGDIEVLRTVDPWMDYGEFENYLESLVGNTYEDKAFMSTTTNAQVVEGTDYIFRIKVPKGKGRGAYIAELSEFGYIESEFLLKRGTKCKVNGITQEGYSKIIDMEVIE